jgi:hypothetical protein
MSIPKRIKVIGQGPTLFGTMADYLTVGKEYDVSSDGYYSRLDDSVFQNREDCVCVIADNNIPTLVRVDGGDCPHGYEYEVVA